MPKYLPTECPKCGADLPKRSPKGGRPSRWCSEGCQRSGEAEMSGCSRCFGSWSRSCITGPADAVGAGCGAIEERQTVMTIWRVCRRNDRPGYHRGSRVSLIR